MFTAIRERLESEEGFTLIELLVVVIIIGILAAIAIPTFLNQRERGWQAELTSGVRNAALEVEADITKTGGDVPIQADGAALVLPFEDGVMSLTYAVVAATATTPEGFSVCGEHDDIVGTHSITYNSVTGGLGDFSDTAGC